MSFCVTLTFHVRNQAVHSFIHLRRTLVNVALCCLRARAYTATSDNKQLPQPTFQPMTHHHLATSSRRVLYSSNQRPTESNANQSRSATPRLLIYKLTAAMLTPMYWFCWDLVDVWSLFSLVFLCYKIILLSRSCYFAPESRLERVCVCFILCC